MCRMDGIPLGPLLRFEVEDRIGSAAEELFRTSFGSRGVILFSCAIYGPLIIRSSRKGVVVGKVGR